MRFTYDGNTARRGTFLKDVALSVGDMAEDAARRSGTRGVALHQPASGGPTRALFGEITMYGILAACADAHFDHLVQALTVDVDPATGVVRFDLLRAGRPATGVARIIADRRWAAALYAARFLCGEHRTHTDAASIAARWPLRLKTAIAAIMPSVHTFPDCPATWGTSVADQPAPGSLATEFLRKMSPTWDGTFIDLYRAACGVAAR